MVVKKSLMTHFNIDLDICSKNSKPHAKRISIVSDTKSFSVELSPRPVGGFLAAEVEALVDAYKAYWSLGSKNNDASLVPLPFDRERFSKRYQYTIN